MLGVGKMERKNKVPTGLPTRAKYLELVVCHQEVQGKKQVQRFLLQALQVAAGENVDGFANS